MRGRREAHATAEFARCERSGAKGTCVVSDNSDAERDVRHLAVGRNPGIGILTRTRSQVRIAAV